MDSPLHDRENLQKTQEGTPNVRTGTGEEEESSSASSGRTSCVCRVFRLKAHVVLSVTFTK
jgi:hypothetical protein